MNSAWRVLIGAVVGLGAFGTLYWAFRPTPAIVEIATVTEGTFRATVEEDGKTRVRDRYIVSAPLSGRLLRIAVKAGDEIKADSVLAWIVPAQPSILDPRSRREAQEKLGAAEAALQEASARLDRARAILDQAKTDVQRVRILEQRGSATAQRREREELNLQTSEREFKAAELRKHATEHDVELARALLRRYDDKTPDERWKVTAPVDGRVLRVVQESEAVVTVGAPLVEIGDPSDLEVIVDLLTTDAVNVKPGADVELERWGGPAALRGRVRRVEPGGFTKVSALGVDEQRVWVIIDITSPREQWSSLGDGFRVDVRIETQTLPQVIIIPVGALFRRESGWAVFTVENSVAHEKRIDLIVRSGRLGAVRSGLHPGEKVIIFPPSNLTEGSRVQLRPS
jgi:HlyD family secretion protein